MMNAVMASPDPYIGLRPPPQCQPQLWTHPAVPARAMAAQPRDQAEIDGVSLGLAAQAEKRSRATPGAPEGCCAKKCPGIGEAAGAVAWGSSAAGSAARD
jgi:hypothetical protein